MNKTNNVSKQALATLAIGATIIGAGTKVHAEVLTGTTPDQNATTQTTATEQVTQGQVDQAKTVLNNDTKAVADQQVVVDNAQKQVNQAQTQVDNAQTQVNQAQEAQAQATPEVIASQTITVSNAQTTVANAQTTIANDQQAINDKQAQVTTQEKVVDNAQTVVDTKQADLNQAKAQEAQAQAILDGTGATELYNQQASLEKTVATDQQAVTNAQTNLTTAKTNDQKLATAITTTSTAISNKITEVSTDKLALDQATTAYNSALSNLNTAQTEKNVAQADVNGINTFVISKEYADTLKAFTNADYGTQLRANLKTKLNELSTALKAQNVYKSNTNDKLVTITDPNNISKDLLKELSLFGSSLENQIRSLFGTVATVVTPDSIDMSDIVTDGYVSDSWGWTSVTTKGHDSNALDAVRTNPDTNVGTSAGENLNSVNYETKLTNLDDVKALIFKAYVDFMFSDSHVSYAHAQSISGLSEDSRATKTFVGVDISSVAGATSVHVNNINDLDTNGVAEFDTTTIQNTKTPQALNAILVNKVRALNNAQTTFNNSKTSLGTAQVAYNTSKSELASLVQQLNTLQATPLQTPTAQAKLNDAQDILAKDTASLKQVNDNIATLEADIAVKKANLDKAKAVVATKELALKQATDTLTTEKAKLATLKSELATLKTQLATDEAKLKEAQTTLAEEQAYLTKLENADENLASAVSDLEFAQQLLQAKTITLSTEIEKLEAFKATQAISEKEYNRLLALLEAQKRAELEAKRQTIEKQGKVAQAIVDELGNVVDYVAQVKGSESISIPTNYVTLTSDSKDKATFNLSNAKALPETGDNSSTLALLGVEILSLLSLSALSKKRKA